MRAPQRNTKSMPGSQGVRASLRTNCASQKTVRAHWSHLAAAGRPCLRPRRRQGSPTRAPPRLRGGPSGVPRVLKAMAPAHAQPRRSAKNIPGPAAVWGWGSETARAPPHEVRGTPRRGGARKGLETLLVLLRVGHLLAARQLGLAHALALLLLLVAQLLLGRLDLDLRRAGGVQGIRTGPGCWLETYLLQPNLKDKSAHSAI